MINNLSLKVLFLTYLELELLKPISTSDNEYSNLKVLLISIASSQCSNQLETTTTNSIYHSLD